MRIQGLLLSLFLAVGLTSTAFARHRSAPTVPTVEIEGIIKSASATELVITDEHNHDVTVEITKGTLFRKGDMAIAPTDLKTGDHVHVKTTMNDKVLTALVVKLDEGREQEPKFGEVSGVIKSVNSTQIVVTDAKMQDTTIAITKDTLIRKGGKAATIGDLAVGDRVEVKFSVNGTMNTALLINAEAEENQPEEVEINGVVTAVATDHITVKTKAGDVTVNVNDKTRIQKDDKTIAIGDIKAGDQVEAKGTKVDDHTILASEIEVSSEKGDS